jgi:hypothetical protein
VTEILTALLNDLEAGGERSEEAALALGLLLERVSGVRPSGKPFPIARVLDEKLAAVRLSASDVERILDRLISVAGRTRDPSAIWALAASRDPRIVAPLVRILERTLESSAEELAAGHCLHGIIETGVESPSNRREAIAAIRRAAAKGRGEVRQLAAEYLARPAVQALLEKD